MVEVLAPSLYDFNVSTCFLAKLEKPAPEGSDAYKHCFTQKAPKHPSFAEVILQAERLHAAAFNKR